MCSSDLTNNNTTLTQLLSFASLQQKYHIPFKNFTMVNTTQGLSFLKQQDADLWLSIRYGKIFKKPAIALPRKGIINLHSGILPDYRGVMATFRAMLNGDSHIGCSLHFIDDDNIDQGRIISRTKILLQKNHSYLWNLINLYTEGCQLLIDAVETLANNNEIFFIKNRDGNKLQGRYFSFPTPQDLCQFAELSYQLFDELEITKLCHSFKAVENP